MDPNLVKRTAPGVCAVCRGTTTHWLPIHKAANAAYLEYRAQVAAETAAAEAGYQEMLDHPESVIDAQDLF